MKNWWQLLLCILLAAVIWLMHNLSQEYVDVISVPVIARSNLDGRAELSSGEVAVVARCRTTGWHLLYNRTRVVTVDFEAEDLKYAGKDIYEIDQSRLANYSRNIFGTEVTPVDFVSEAVRFRFEPENSRKVPVEAICKIAYRPEYTASSVVIVPDSVTVYGNPDVVGNIDKVLTDPVVLKDVSRSMHGITRLKAPSGLRISDDKVAYTVNVTRFVDIRTKVEIGTRRVPSRKTFYVIPSEAEVTFRCVFPLKEDPVGKVDFYVDYNDFQNSMTGRCVIRSSQLPEGVIAYSVSPEVCDCVEAI